MSDIKVVTLKEYASQRETRKADREPAVVRSLWSCRECNSYGFKILTIDGVDWLCCANCENYIQEFELVRTIEDMD